MYVCVGHAQGEGQLFDCGPWWDFEPPYYCKVDDAEHCGSEGCPGCLRYPAAPRTENVARVSTQVLVFRGSNRAELRGTVVIPVKNDTGLEPGTVVNELRRIGIQAGALIGYEVETNVGMTASRHRAADGSGIFLQSSSKGGGFEVRLYGLEDGAIGRKLESVWVANDEAATFPATLSGMSCLVVVHSIASAPQPLEAVLNANHEPFTSAASRYASREIIGIRVDRPRIAPAALETFLRVQALTDNMLSAPAVAIYR